MFKFENRHTVGIESPDRVTITRQLPWELFYTDDLHNRNGASHIILFALPGYSEFTFYPRNMCYSNSQHPLCKLDGLKS